MNYPVAHLLRLWDRLSLGAASICVSLNVTETTVLHLGGRRAFLEQPTCLWLMSSMKTPTSTSAGRKAPRLSVSEQSFCRWQPRGSKLLGDGRPILAHGRSRQANRDGHLFVVRRCQPRSNA